MINRILIRLKVVQMLYSYLLTRNDFSLVALPENESRDKKYAYSIYLRLIDAIIRMSGYVSGASRPVKADDPVLHGNSTARELLALPALKGLLLDKEIYAPLPEDVLESLSATIAKSKVYADYKKSRKKNLEDDIKFWCVIADTIFAKDPELIAYSRKSEEFSLSGYTRGISWLRDTLLSYGDSRAAYLKSGKDLEAALNQAYHLYVALFVLMANITREQEKRLETAKSKHLATNEDLNPDLRFVNNRLIKAIEESGDLTAYLKANPLDWDNEQTLVRSLLDAILSSEIYADYMALPQTNLETDCELWRNILKYIILPSDDLAEALEAKSVYWNDDLHIMGTFALKSVKKVAQDPEGLFKLLPKYKDEEDSRFGQELFKAVIDNRIEYRELIDKFVNSDNWDPERIAFMDFVIMLAAIAELINFPEIAVAVTMNEYVEIANAYSTDRSGRFVNGVLFAVYNCLVDQGKIKK